ncbi:MAG TPA: hypothetical protein VF581_05755 [Flavobacterium sp.]|jgi:hypothetical protein
MKKITTWMLAAAGCFAFASCSDDDNGNPQGGGEDTLAGVYRLTTWTSPIGQDLDGDGDSSANLMTEHSCYTGGTITLNEDGTFTSTSNTVFTTDGELDCTSETINGIWTEAGSSITMTNGVGSETAETEFNLSTDNTVLTTTGPGEYPIFFENNIILEPGVITKVYVKDQAQ